MRRLAAAALLALAAGPLAAQERPDPCALAELDGGIGGTGVVAQEGGIGGTGIVGTVTGFASICVNGVEVHYAPDVPVTWNGLAWSAAGLAVGQVVAVEAASAPAGLEARSIAILAAVAGRVDSRDATTLTVLGQRVATTARTRVVDEQGRAIPLFALKAGEAVAVSGLRRPDGTILASRIERPQALPREGLAPAFSFAPGVRRLLLEGYVERDDGESMVLLGRRIRLAPQTPPTGTPPLSGLRVVVLAAVAPDGTLSAERLALPRAALVAPPAPREGIERKGLELPGRIPFEPRPPPRVPERR